MASITLHAPAPDDLIDLWSACHERARSHLDTALALSRGALLGAPAAGDCKRVLRYFTEALPRHAADEDLSLRPRILAMSPRLLERFTTLAAEHERHDVLLEPLVPLWTSMIAEPPESVEDPRLPALAAATPPFAAHLRAHLDEEERWLLAAMRELDPAAQRAVVDEIRARRR